MSPPFCSPIMMNEAISASMRPTNLTARSTLLENYAKLMDYFAFAWQEGQSISVGDGVDLGVALNEVALGLLRLQDLLVGRGEQNNCKEHSSDESYETSHM